MTTVAIVEDNAGLQNGLKLLLDTTPGYQCAGVFSSGEDALRQIPRNPPQVVLMDIHLPNISGIECTEKLKELVPGIVIVMITAYGDHDKIFKALRAGASGYLLKRSSPDEIIQAIHDVLHGGSPMTSEVARKVVEAFQQPTTPESEDHNLSRREKEVLELLSQGRADKDIASQLCVSVPTVRFHLKHIYEKLHVRSRTEAALKFSRNR
ncbi:MAG: response regulator transcription factor [Akkermansiaceae bacterium]